MSGGARKRPAPERRDRRTVAARLVVGAAAVLPFIALAFDGVNQAAAAAATAGVAMLLAAAAVLSFGGEHLIPAARARVPVIALAIALAAGTARIVFPLAGQDHDPDAILIELAKIAGFAACTVTGLLIAADQRRLERLLAWLVYAGGAYLIVALVAGAPLIIHAGSTVDGRFGGTLANSNAAGCVFGMLALLALGRTLALVRRPEFYQLDTRHIAALGAAGAIAFFALGACALTQSRTALGGTVVLALAILITNFRKGDKRTLRTALVVMALVIAAAAMLELGDAITGRLGTLSADTASRWAAYRHLAGIIGEAPWLGHGLGSFITVNVTHLDAATVPTMWNWGAGHNIVLHALIEGGWALTAPVLVVWGAIAVQIARGASSVDGASAPAAAVVLAALCASVDIALNVPAVAAFAALLLGVAWGSHALNARRGSEARLLPANRR